ncbi:MAG: cell division protein FtsX [Pseudomonadota bacterium]
MSANSREAPLLPVSDARESALFFVVCALCFLAAMAALSARATYGAAADWTSEVEGEITVRLMDVDSRAARDAERLIGDMNSVVSSNLVEREDIAELLAPWFGRDGLPASLPLPMLVEVKTAPDAGRIGPDIERELAEAGISARADDHADWAGDVRRSLATIRLVALGAVALLAATAVAVIAFATHAALLARRDIVDVLHLSGAEDRFIANLFERRFWVLGLQAGAVGALAALGGVAIMLFSANSVSVDRSWLLPTLNLDLWDVIILLLSPIVAGFAARMAARVTVVRSLAGTV